MNICIPCSKWKHIREKGSIQILVRLNVSLIAGYWLLVVNLVLDDSVVASRKKGQRLINPTLVG